MVLLRCGGCDNLHLIADNQGWFRDEKVNIQDILREKGEQVITNIGEESIEFRLKTDEEDSQPN